MANIKQAIKRVRVNETKTQENGPKKSAMKTAIKKFNTAVEENSSEVEVLFNQANKAVDMAAASKVISKNKAAREKSKLAKNYNTVK